MSCNRTVLQGLRISLEFAKSEQGSDQPDLHPSQQTVKAGLFLLLTDSLILAGAVPLPGLFKTVSSLLSLTFQLKLLTVNSYC